MSIIIFMGDDQSSSLQKLKLLKQKFDPFNIHLIQGESISIQELRLASQTKSLFPNPQLLVWESPPPNLELEALELDPSLTLALVFNKNLPPNSKLLKTAKTRSFQVIQSKLTPGENIFPFLDALAAKKPIAHQHLDKMLSLFGSQYILTMIIYLLRQFATLSLQPQDSYTYKKRSLELKHFSLERLKYLYEQTLKTDYKIKSGNIEEKIALTFLVERFLH